MIRNILCLLLLGLTGVTAQDILPLRERAAVIEQLQEERLNQLLPKLMAQTDLDLWVLITREYNEDPVVKTLLPPTWLNARRRTILVFAKDPKTGAVERVALSRYAFGKHFPSVWNKEEQPDQFQALADYIVAKKPQKIGLNISGEYGIADGLVQTDYQGLYDALPPAYRKRLVSAEPLAVAWIETRTEQEMVLFQQLTEIPPQIVAEAFSSKVITPGVTTTEDVVWWMRDKIRALGLQTWFHPTVDIQRADPERFDHLRTFSKRPDTQVIQPGDLLHCDFGITYLRLNTDQQQHAYVLRSGESEAPEFLTSALATGNRLQDIFTGNFKLNRTGNEVLAISRATAIDEGITPSIYTHPIGYHGHAAGTTLGMWDSQGGVPFTGDYPLHATTAYSIELNASVAIQEWGKDVRIMLEEEAFFDGEKVRYIDGRQTRLIIVNQP